MSISLQHKRLFVGGLNSQTNEQDIRDRFKAFGVVSSVELHKILKKEGFPEKTFAYINLESTEINIKRCISMLSNTKWRGGILKVESAKESFLSRLRKEREQVKTEQNTSKQSAETSIPKELMEPVRNAVPGTQLPGQKNWVVGKFGRALPVVHIRPKHGRKIMKFDPSKTVHNLKKIKDEAGDSKNVSELTWNLESRDWCDPWDRNKTNGTENTIIISDSDESSDEVVKTKDKSKMTKKNDNYFNNMSDKLSNGKASKKNVLQNETDFNGNVKKRHKTKDTEKKSTDEYMWDKLERDTTEERNSPMDEYSLVKAKKKDMGIRKDQNTEGKEVGLVVDLKDNITASSIISLQIQNGFTEKVNRKCKRKKQRNDVEENNDLIKDIDLTNDNVPEEEIIYGHYHEGAAKKIKKKGKSEKIVYVEDDTTINNNSLRLNKKAAGKAKVKCSFAEVSEQLDAKAPDKSLINNSCLRQKNTKKHKEKTLEKPIIVCTVGDDSPEVHLASKANATNKCHDKITVEHDVKLSTNSDKKKRICKEKKSKNVNVSSGQIDEGVFSGARKALSTEVLLYQGKVNKKKLSSNKNISSKKKATSNEKRLKAIEERKVNTRNEQSLISNALKNLDTNDKLENLKHIKFDDRDVNKDWIDKQQEKTTEYQEKHKKPLKVSGSKAANWLGLDSDSDESTALFEAKPQFEGKAGQQLFQLQKSYRGDSRFQLDKRFIESDDSDDNSTPASPKYDMEKNNMNDDDGNDGDELTKQLSQEKSMEMAVLQGILGDKFTDKLKSSSQKHTFKDTNLLRYDPTRDDHAQYEQAQKRDDKRDDKSDEPAIKDKRPSKKKVDMRMRDVPEVAVDKYYDVKTDALSDMFSGKAKDNGPNTFTFLSSQDNEEESPRPVDWGQAEEFKSKAWSPVMLPYDSSGEEEGQGDRQEKPEKEDHSIPDERFFFHFGDSELESSVYDKESAFMRTSTLKELDEHWVKVRSELTQDYKKKHKDAMRRHSKMAAKRARTR